MKDDGTSGGLKVDERGFAVRAQRYGRVSRKAIIDMLGYQPGDALYRSYNDGVRTAEVVDANSVDIKPGDTFSLGPTIAKGAERPPEPILREVSALRGAGFGAAEAPLRKPWGWELLLKGWPLPGGVRTTAMILLPLNYPAVPPVGFYVRKDASIGRLDRDHFFTDRTYHDAVDLTKEGWSWFCGVPEGWRPGRHTLVGFVSAVLAFFNERR